MWDFMFVDTESGEEFFVECDNLFEAWKIVHDNFGSNANVRYIRRYTVEQAEMMGLDTY